MGKTPASSYRLRAENPDGPGEIYITATLLAVFDDEVELLVSDSRFASKRSGRRRLKLEAFIAAISTGGACHRTGT